MVDFKDIKNSLIDETKEKVRAAVSADMMIIQAMNTVDELNKILNTMAKRLREWHAYALPELEHLMEDNEAYCRMISSKSYDELKEEFAKNSTMGNFVDEKDLAIQQKIAKTITENYFMKDEILNYIEDLMKKYLPNVQIMAGTNIGARLLVSAGSFKKLATLPASTIQMLGAEKALFRHLRSGSRPPKHGFIINHPYVSNAGKDKGKAARMLADKISMCARVDYFKGEIVALKFKEDLDKKFLK